MGDYNELFTYDGNGNILTVNRAGSGTGTLKNIVTYKYNVDTKGRLLNNRLNYLSGTAAASNITPDQAANNYQYDPIGNLVKDAQSGITNIGWTVYQKIDTIYKTAGNTDARIAKKTGSGPLSPIDHYEPTITSIQDYYSFGMLQPGRQYTFGTDSTYRYGFNGKENDNTVKGLGNQQDYGERIYDPRVGRFLSVDPMAKQYPELTPYQFASNSPVQNIDLDGLEGVNAFAEGGKRGEDPMAAMRTAGKTTFKFIGGLVYGAVAIVFAPFNGISEAHYANNSKTPEQRAYHNKEASKYFKETAFNLITAEIGGELFGKMGKAVTVFSEVELNLAGKTTLSVLENDASRAASFKGGKFAISIAKEDITVYRVSGGTSGAGNGEFFSLTKPNNVADAEKMLNINMHGNTGEYVTPVVIKKGSQFAVGGVEGGSGTQLFIPKEVQNTGGNNIERLLDKTKSLPK